MANLNIAQLPVLSGLPSDDARFIVQQGSGTFQVTGEQLRAAYGGASGGPGGVQSVQAGSGIAVDDTDPENPVVAALLEQGANVTITPGTAPGSLRISASGGGGGGGGGKTEYTPILKVGAGLSLTAAEVTDSALTPFINTNASNIDMLLTGINGVYLLVFLTVGAPCTLTNPTGSNMFDQSTSAQSVITIAANEVVQMIVNGDGTNWSGNVITRY